MRRVLLLSAAVLLAACSTGQYSRRIVMKTPLNITLLRTGVMLKKIGDKPTISLTRLTNNVRSFTVHNNLARFRISAVSSNRTAVTVYCRGKKQGNALLEFLRQTTLANQPRETGEKPRSLPGLYGLHFLSPALSGVYAEYRNPFSGRKQVWAKFLLHIGVDALGTVAASTEGFRKDFRFSTATLAVLVLHRLITLPRITIETDLYNKAVRAGYRFRF